MFYFSDQPNTKQSKTEQYDSVQDNEDDYEEWKHRILTNAHKALGKPYKRK